MSLDLSEFGQASSDGRVWRWGVWTSASLWASFDLGEFGCGRLWTWTSLDLDAFGCRRVWRWASLEVGEFGGGRVWRWASLEVGEFKLG